MMVRILGSCLIITSCGSFGWMITRALQNDIFALKNFISAIEYMECELRYRMTPLPKLCLEASAATNGVTSRLFHDLCVELESCAVSKVLGCMEEVLRKNPDVSEMMSRLWLNLGKTMGLFDLEGQAHMLASLRREAEGLLRTCEEGHLMKSRSYKTIALCAGAAIVVLLL